MHKIIIYTAVSKGYDTPKPPPQNCLAKADCVAFCNRKEPVPGWNAQPLYRGFRDPCRNAKIHKILPHLYFPKHEYSLWVDGSVEMNDSLDVTDLIERYLSNHDLAVFKHRHRHCAYREAKACIARGKDSSAIIHRQMRRYHAEGYPRNNGLVECGVLLRRHTAQIKNFNERWYAEIAVHSRRDQLSFNYVAHQLILQYELLPGNLDANPYFKLHQHRGIKK